MKKTKFMYLLAIMGTTALMLQPLAASVYADETLEEEVVTETEDVIEQPEDAVTDSEEIITDESESADEGEETLITDEVELIEDSDEEENFTEDSVDTAEQEDPEQGDSEEQLQITGDEDVNADGVNMAPTLTVKNGIITKAEGGSGEYTIPDTYLGVGTGAFWNCDEITKITIGSNIRTIGTNAFRSMDALKEVHFDGNFTSLSIDDSAFYSDKYLTTINLPSCITKISQDMFNGCEGLKSIDLPAGLETIGANAFDGAGLTQIKIPANVNKIDDWAFHSCTNLLSITFGDDSKLESTGTNVFGHCEKLKKIVLPGKLTQIENYTFYGCYALTDITLPENISIIGKEAFYGTNIRNFTISSSVQSIDASAFAYCKKLVELKDDSTANIPASCFLNCCALKEITLKDGVEEIGQNAFKNCTVLKTVNLPNTVDTIDAYAFDGCSALVEATVPESVVTLGKDAYSKIKTKLIYGKTGSAAETFANNNGIAFYDPSNPKTFKITYGNIDGAVNKNPKSYKAISDKITLSDAVKKGYKFVKWTDADSSKQVKEIAKYSMGNRKLKANWTAITYSVRYNSNGGSGSMSYNTAKYDDTFALNANKYTRTGYKFKGWNTKSDGSGTSFKDKQKVSNLTATDRKAVTLYAQWKPITYTISFDANGGSGKMKSVNAVYSKNYKLPKNAFTKKGYKFKGWNTKKNGSGKTYKNASAIKNLTSKDGKCVVLYAMWGK